MVESVVDTPVLYDVVESVEVASLVESPSEDAQGVEASSVVPVVVSVVLAVQLAMLLVSSPSPLAQGVDASVVESETDVVACVLAVVSPELEHGVLLSSVVTLLTTVSCDVWLTLSKSVASVSAPMATSASARWAKSLVTFMALQ